MSDTLLERLGSGTGQERLEVRHAIGGGTVSLVREHMRVPGALGMVGWLAGATTPAEYGATVQISVPVGARVVLDEEAAADTAAVLGGLKARLYVKPTLRLSAAPVQARIPEEDSGETQNNVTSEDRGVMRAIASRVAAERPAAEVQAPQIPELVGNPVDDARRLFGLTVAQLASLLGITERQVYRLDPARMPTEHRERLNALVALGLLLAGGLGPEGAKRWLDAGVPSGADLLRAGRYRLLRERAEELKDSVAT